MTQKQTLSANQDKAANPAENVWVQANAGTGKTSVLVQRLLRILFRSPDLDNSGILCLTYTNAAVGEMRNRILKSLRIWARATDEELRDLLEGISENKTVQESDIIHAREIFYKYIDNPEILKIKTIHGFCEEILRRFPIEAGISPSWTLVQDANQRVLLQDTFNQLINTNQSSLNTSVKDAFLYLVERISENYMDTLLETLSGQYKHFFQIKDFVNYRKYFIDTTKKFLDLDSPVQTEVSPEKLRNIVENIKSIKKPAKYLTTIIEKTEQYVDNAIDFEEYKSAYLTKDGRRNRYIVKTDFLQEELERVYAVNQHNINELVFKDTVALFDLSSAFADIYKKTKAKHNFLDFEDLILYTRKLFSSPENMGWVLSQLNISLSHILVDEAQDTSPLQWDVLRMLSGDFFTEGDTEKHRHSLFVVGDTKQSIYGFQGADPRAFAVSRQDIGQQIEQNNRTIQDVPLAQSFRSLPAILNTVDLFFGNEEVIEKTGFINNTHASFRKDQKGLVEINKLISQTEDEIDATGYVKIVADKIKSIIDSGKCPASDIMVLVQKRYPLGAALVNELKKKNIPVAGSDRIVLPEFPAVRDLLYLVRFCLNTFDDYSLCCVLKSPLFRLKEQDIFNLCQVKNSENSQKKSENPDFIPTTVFDVLKEQKTQIYEILNQYIDWSKKLAPYSFFTSVLNDNKNRQKIIAALGNQVIDPLEEFLTICLAYERTQPGTLKHFLKWFITGGSEIKRDMDASSGVRVVTVHGSKGLEAPVVFLIDTVNLPKSDDTIPLTQELLKENGCRTDDKYPDLWLWSKGTKESEKMSQAVQAQKDLRIAEYYRLLYVAMTRAKNELYIYGYTPNINAPELSWHSMLWQILYDSPKAIKDDNTIRFTDD